MNIILVGFMGTGKTAVGKRLAKRLGWQFVDVDQLIETGARMSVARIFAERSEAIFRRLERRCISRLILGRQQVIATGGGAFVDSQNRSRLRVSGPVICLTARPRVILSRVGQKPGERPLLHGRPDPLSRIKALLGQRSAAYAQADLTIDTSDLSVDDVVERVWRHLSPYVCKGWQYLLDHAEELSQRYGGRYVVVVEDRIVASGQTQLEAYQHARVTSARSLRLERGQGRPPSRHAVEAGQTGIYYIPLPEESLTAL